MPNDQRIFAMTGMPRSGTTYLAAVIHHPPRVVALSEARGRWKTLYARDGIDADPLPVLREFRDRVARREPVASFEGTAGYAGAARVDTWNQEKRDQVLQIDQGFVLGMKNPEVFLAWLGRLLDAGVPCVVSVRHPLGVISSWVRHNPGSPPGTFANGECVTFSARSTDPVARRIELHNHFVAQIARHLDHPLLAVARYEAWFEGPEQLATLAEFLEVPCRPRLQPPPIAPEPVQLSATEQRRILEECAVASVLGYALDQGSLRPDPLAGAASAAP